MAITAAQANAQLATITTVDQLRTLISQLAVHADGTTTLLYSGGMPGGGGSDAAAKALGAANSSIRILDNTEAAKFLDLSSENKNLALEIKLFELFGSNPSTPGSPANQFMYGAADANGNRVSLGAWDDVSGRFAAATTGDVRVLAYGANATRVFGATELKVLLANGAVTSIEGIPMADLKAIETRYGVNGLGAAFDRVRLVSELNIVASGIRATPAGGGVSVTEGDFLKPELLDLRGYMVGHPEAHARLDTFLQGLSPAERAERLGVSKLLLGLAEGTYLVQGARVLNKLGFVGTLFSLALATTGAQAAQAAGQPEQANKIMAEWAADAAGSEVGSLIGTAIGGIAVAAAAAAGLALSVPLAGAVVLGSALVGAFWGADAAKDFADYLTDRDENGRIDALDKLKALVFGADWTVSDTPPQALIEKALQMNASFALKALELSYTREDVVAMAKTNIAWRYALRELNVFAIDGLNYDEHNADKSLDLFDPLTDEGAMTEEYLKDRAAMLMWKVRFDRGMSDDNDGTPFDGPKPYNQDWDTNAVQGNWDFVDYKHLIGGDPLTLAIDGAGLSLHDHQVVFGSNKDETLNGEGDDDRMYGGGGVDTIHGRKGDDYVEGQGGKDLLHGDEGRDTLRGGTDDDQLFGGVDGDELHGDAGADVLNGGTGNDLLLGGAGNDELNGDADNDFLNGGLGADTLKGGSGNDILFDEGGTDTQTLWGESGNDQLEIKAGTAFTFLDGGSGNDVLVGSRQSQLNALTGGTGNDILRGGEQADILVGDGGVADEGGGEDGADLIEGAEGNDSITGGGGADLLRGGADDDSYYFAATGFGTDLIQDASGNNKLFFGGAQLLAASWDEDKRAWVSGSTGMEIRKLEAGGATTLAISNPGDADSTLYLRNWTAGQYGISLDGQAQERQKPGVAPSTQPVHPSNNEVNVMRGDARDGGQGNDILIGSAAASLLLGGVGNDLLDGRGGDDWLEGGDGGDLIVTGEGMDVAKGGIGNDLIRAGYNFDFSRNVDATGNLEPEAFFWAGANYNDWLAHRGDEDTSSEFHYYVERFEGDSNPTRKVIPYPQFSLFDIRISREYSADSGNYLWWIGETGSASISLQASVNVDFTLGHHQFIWRGTVVKVEDAGLIDPHVLGKPYQLRMEMDHEGSNPLQAGTNRAGAQLWGGEGDDILYGANENDVLNGEADSDILVGMGGSDSLSGEAGNDSLAGGDGRDLLDGGSEQDFLVGGLGADVVLGGDGADKLLGDAPYLVGATSYPAGVPLSAMGGDLLDGGQGNDSLWGNHGDDLLFGGSDHDVLYGGEGHDRLSGELGSDTLWGDGGDDHLDGGAEKDTLYGGTGADLLQGGGGDDQLEAEVGDDQLDGGEGADTLYGGDGHDLLKGGSGNDKLYGDGPDGANGNDTLEGGAGNDWLQGASGADAYVFAVGDGQDEVQDDGSNGARNSLIFKIGSGDVRTVRRDGLDLLVEYGSTDSVRVKGFYGIDEYGLGYEGHGALAIDLGEAQPRIAEIRFEDGTVWGLEDILAMAPAPTAAELPPDPLAALKDIYFVNALLSRDEVRSAGKQTLTFSFAETATGGEQDFHLYSTEQKQAVRDALARFSEVLNLSFVEQADSAASDVRFFIDDLTSEGMGGFSGHGSAQSGEVHMNSFLYAATREDEFGRQVVRESMAMGQMGFEVLLHEIGHVLGLKHPFEAPLLPRDENSNANTVMSYTRQAPRIDLGQFDIAALQYWYGLPQTVNAGDTVHRFGERWVQDASGLDRFDASQETAAVSIDLQPGAWIYKGSKAESILAEHQAFIGFGSTIEHAMGGSGNDTLTGNDGANLLQGGLGDDLLAGGLGIDTLEGGDGSDTYVWTPGDANDLVRDLGPGADADVLRLKGVTALSQLLLSSAGQDVEVFHVGTQTKLTLVGQLSGQGVEWLELDGGLRFDRSDLLALVDATPPSEGADVLRGTNSNDTLNGLGGNDRIEGRDGNDVLIGGDGIDTVLGGNGDDRLDAEYVEGGAGNDTLLGGAGGALKGGAGSDTYDLRQAPSSGPALFVVEDVDAGADEDVVLLPSAFTASNLRAELFDMAWFDANAERGKSHSIKLSAEGHAVYLQDVIWPDGRTASLEKVVLGDGTELTGGQLLAMAMGRPTAGNDRWSGTVAADSVDLGAGNDLADGDRGNDTLTGGAGDDTLRGNKGDDRYIVQAGSGFDTLMDLEGTDTIKLQDALPGQVGLYRQGNNLWIYRNDDPRAQILVLDQFTPFLQIGSMVMSTGTVKVERIEFSDGSFWNEADITSRLAATPPDFLNLDFQDAGDTDDLVNGNKGNNRLTSVRGADTLVGGLGDDFYEVDTPAYSAVAGEGNDVIVELPDQGHDTLATRAWITRLPANVEDLIHEWSQKEYLTADGKPKPVQLVGNALNNRLSRGSTWTSGVEGLMPSAPWAFILDGGLGSDTLVGGSGADTFMVESAGDVVIDTVAGDGDTVISTINFTLPEMAENLTLSGGSVGLLGQGNALANLLVAQGTQADTLVGGAGDDVYDISGNVVVLELAGGGNDTVRLAAGNFEIASFANVEVGVLQHSGSFMGTAGNDVLRFEGTRYGEAILRGLAGDDDLRGSQATLDGGQGDDTLQTSGGRVIWRQGDGHDRLTLTGSLGSSGTDILVAGATALGDLGFIRQGRDLAMTHQGLSALTMAGYFASTEGPALTGESIRVLSEQSQQGGSLNGGTWFAWDQIEQVLAADPSATLRLGSAGADTLVGSSGNDKLFGGSDDDLLDGGEGADLVAGEFGNDTLVGGAEDTLLGGAGNDVYRPQGGVITIFDESGASDVLELPEGVTQSQVTVRQVGEALTVQWTAGANAVSVEAFFKAGANSLEALKFADGSQWSRDELVLRARLIEGDSGDNWLNGNASPDILRGLAGNDTLYGQAGDDTLVGGLGNDRIDGGDGHDVYLLARGDGTDTIPALTYSWDNSNWSGVYPDKGVDTLRFEAGIAPSDVSFARVGNNLELRIAGGTDKVVVESYYRFENPLASPLTALQRVEFADGTVWTMDRFDGLSRIVSGTGNSETLNGSSSGDRLLGLAGNDTLNGSGGEDWLEGGDGNDSLVGGSGDDVVVGGSGNDVYVVADRGDLVVERAAGGYDKVVSSLSFMPSDQSYFLAPHVEELTLTGTSGKSVTGNDQHNLIVASSGSDVLQGGAGSDTLRGQGGNDQLSGDAGNDLLDGGDGDDYLSDAEGTDVLLGGLGTDELHHTGKAGSKAMLNGGAGDDTLEAIAQASAVTVMVGGSGADQLRATEADHQGAVIALFNRGDGVDTLYPGNWDKTTIVSVGAGLDLSSLSIASVDRDATQTWFVRLGLGDGDSLGLHSYFAGTALPGKVLLQVVSDTDIKVYDLGAVIREFVETKPSDFANWPIAQKLGAALVSQSTDTAWGGGLAVQYARGANLDAMSATVVSAFLNVEDLGVKPVSIASPPLVGSSEADVMTGGAAADLIRGLAGNDTLDGAAGADTLEGGSGDDTLVVDHAGDVALELANEGNDTVVSSISYTLGNQLENLELTGTAANGTGNQLDNRLTGNAASNVLAGLDGNDSLDGGAGNDTLEGGAGDDSYWVDAAGDLIIENAGSGQDLVFASTSYTLSSHVEELTLTGTVSLNATGNAMANKLTGNSGANVLTAAGGADTLVGGAGDDTYGVDAADQQAVELLNEGIDTVQASVHWTLGANLEKLTLTGSANLNGTGNALANTLIGNAGANVLDGGAGKDTMQGGAGDDLYKVDDTGDVITELAAGGIDWVEASVTYILSAEVEHLQLLGTAAINGTGNGLNNQLLGNSANNNLNGGAGNDTLNGGAGNDTMVGGAGDDVFYVDAAGDVVTESASQGNDKVFSSVSYTLGSNVESLELTGTVNLNATGNTTANSLIGNAGNNTLDGKAGADTLRGGAGDDLYIVDATTDVVVELTNEGIDTVRASVNWTLGAELENLEFTGTSARTGVGNALNNRIVGSSGADTLRGLGGNDTLEGGSGNDSMLGGAGDDVYIVAQTGDMVSELANEGVDTVRSSITYTLATNVERLELQGTTAINGTGNTLDNVIIGNTGVNSLGGGAGNDTLDGGAGKDTLIGGAGNDVFVVDVAGETITEVANEGTDSVRSSVTWTLGANLENLEMMGAAAINGTGNSAANLITGNSAANVLTGDAGNDTLIGGAGNDSLLGGTGADTYRFGLGDGQDRINENDSTAGVLDWVEFGAGILQSNVSFVRNVNALEIRVASGGDTLTIDNWFVAAANKVERFKFADSSVLTDSQVAGLVQAMAAFDVPPAQRFGAGHAEEALTSRIGVATGHFG